MLLISAVIWQTQQTAMYRQFAISAGTIIPTPEMLKAERKLLHTELAVIVMYFTSLWIIKLSFLVFFRRLGQKVKGQKIWWWCVLLFTIGTWGLCIGVINFDCLVRPLDYIEGKYVCFLPETLKLIVESGMRSPTCTEKCVYISNSFLCGRRDQRCCKLVL